MSHNMSQNIRLSTIATLLILVLLGFFKNDSYASQLPRYLGNEKKFRAYVYNPNDVYRYIGHYTYQGFIEFGGGEAITTISMGDPSLWLFEHLGNRLFLKPIAKNADTNMTIITDLKVYHFELTAKIATSIDDSDLIFVAKFIYPDEKDKNILQFAKKPKSDAPDMRNLSLYNFNYEFTGEPTIAPVKVFDNGIFTYMQFSEANPEVPAIFSVDSSGFEELVNFRVAENYIIVERVAAQFTLRSGSDIVCVYNSNRLKTGVVTPRAAAARPVSRRISTPGRFGSPSSSGPSRSPVPGFGGSNPFSGSPSRGGASSGRFPPTSSELSPRANAPQSGFTAGENPFPNGPSAAGFPAPPPGF
jgi:type IV secretion system protein VirB9